MGEEVGERRKLKGGDEDGWLSGHSKQPRGKWTEAALPSTALYGVNRAGFPSIEVKSTVGEIEEPTRNGDKFLHKSFTFAQAVS